MFGHTFQKDTLKRKPEENRSNNNSKSARTDEVFDTNYTIHCYSSYKFPGIELKEAYPCTIHYLTNKEQALTTNEIDTLELFSKYASMQCKLKHPIFSYQKYQEAGIKFYAFLIQIRLSTPGIQLVLFFDNYETQNQDTFQLRFEWWQPGTRDLRGNFQHAIERIQNKLQFTENAIGTKRTFVRKFNTAPYNSIATPFSDKIPQRFFPQIQLPLLDPKEWQLLEPILDENNHSILGENHTCLLATGNIPPCAQQMAKTLASYLMEDEGYDLLTYRESQENEHDIYFIMNPNLSFCTGVFVFSNEGKNCSKILQDIQAIKNNPNYIESDPDFFKSNISKLQSLHTESSNTPYEEKFMLRFMLEHLLYNFFYQYGKDHFPSDTQHIKILTTAWIHPFHRNESILTKLWPIFIQKYGVFDIDYPSNAFRNFLEKHKIPYINLTGEHVLVTAMPPTTPNLETTLSGNTTSNNNNNQPAPTQSHNVQEEKQAEEPTPLHSPGSP